MEWTIDDTETAVEFRIKSLWGLVTVKGQLPVRQSRLEMEGSDPGRWSVYTELDAANLKTGNARRDTHLRSPQFFEVNRYPTITFRSQRIEQTGEMTFRVNGELTIRDTTQPVTLEVSRTGTSEAGSSYFQATTRLLRHDFGLSYSKMPIGREVVINLKVKAVQISKDLSEAGSR